MYNSVDCNAFAVLCNHHLVKFQKMFTSLKEKPTPSRQPLASTSVLPVSMDSPNLNISSGVESYNRWPFEPSFSHLT